MHVFILMEPLTCSSLLSPTPPRPGSALRCSGTGLLLSCHSLFQTESQSVGPTGTFRSSSTNAGSAGAEIPARGRDTEKHQDRIWMWVGGVMPCFHFHLRLSLFSILTLSKGVGRLSMTCNLQISLFSGTESILNGDRGNCPCFRQISEHARQFYIWA